MQTIRRFYLYAVTLVSLEIVLWGIIGLARSIFDGAQSGEASRLASALSFILVGTPVFLLHGWLAQRAALQDTEERGARTRAWFFYGALLATLIPAVQNLLALIDRFLLALFDLRPQSALIGGHQNLSDNLIALTINLLVAAYLLSVLRADWAARTVTARGEADALLSNQAFPETRRLYRYVWLVYGLGLTVFGSQQVIYFLLQQITPSASNPTVLFANGLALLVIGAAVGWFSARTIQQSLFEVEERYSLQRLIVLYLLALFSLVGLLVAAGLVLDSILRALLGAGLAWSGLIGRISTPLSAGIPLGVTWWYTNGILKREMKETSGHPVKSGLRRIYAYLLALAGLSVTVVGLYLLLGVVIDIAARGTYRLPPSLAGRLADALSTLITGLPLWILAWRSMQREAYQDGEPGDRARRSLVRKSYLYLALFAGVIGVMFSAGNLLYEWLRTWLGSTQPDLLLDSLRLARTLLLFAGLLAYHWSVLRRDVRLAGGALARRHALYPVLVLTPGPTSAQSTNGERPSGDVFAAAMLEALHRQAPALPVAVHSANQGAPDETLSAARAVILPSELAAKPSEAMRLWLQGFSGVRLIVPTPIKDWYWVPGSGHELTDLTRQAAQIVRHLAEGENPAPPRETSPWLTLVYILAGLFVLEVVIVLLVNLVANFSSPF